MEHDAPLTGYNSMRCCLQAFAFISFHQIFVLYFCVCLFDVVGAQLHFYFNVSCGDAFVYNFAYLGPGEFECINETVVVFILHGRVSTVFSFCDFPADVLQFQ